MVQKKRSYKLLRLNECSLMYRTFVEEMVFQIIPLDWFSFI